MKKLNLVGRAHATARKYAGRTAAAATGLVVAGSASAATTPVDQVLASITAGQADAIKIAVGVVVALWAIWGIYLMRRKG